MKFSIFTVVALLGASATAATVPQPPMKGFEVRMKRQENKPSAEVPSMTDANGNVVPYNREGAAVARKMKAKRALDMKSKH